MTVIACPCLNVRLQAEAPAQKPSSVLSRTSTQNNRFFVLAVSASSCKVTYTVFPKLVSQRHAQHHDGSRWLIRRCTNCGTDLFATCSENDKLLVNREQLKLGEKQIANQQLSEHYSPVFKVLVSNRHNDSAVTDKSESEPASTATATATTTTPKTTSSAGISTEEREKYQVMLYALRDDFLKQQQQQIEDKVKALRSKLQTEYETTCAKANENTTTLLSALSAAGEEAEGEVGVKKAQSSTDNVAAVVIAVPTDQPVDKRIAANLVQPPEGALELDDNVMFELDDESVRITGDGDSVDEESGAESEEEDETGGRARGRDFEREENGGSSNTARAMLGTSLPIDIPMRATVQQHDMPDTISEEQSGDGSEQQPNNKGSEETESSKELAAAAAMSLESHMPAGGALQIQELSYRARTGTIADWDAEPSSPPRE